MLQSDGIGFVAEAAHPATHQFGPVLTLSELSLGFGLIASAFNPLRKFLYSLCAYGYSGDIIRYNDRRRKYWRSSIYPKGILLTKTIRSTRQISYF